MKRLILSITIFALVVFLGCGGGGSSENSTSDKNTSETNASVTTGTKVNYEVLELESGNFIEKSPSGALVKIVENQAEFEKIYALSNSSNPNRQMPKVDFTKNNVLAMFYGGSVSGSFGISLKDLRVDNNITTAYINSNITGGLCGTVTDDVTSPFSFVSYPKTKDEPIFKGSYEENFPKDESCVKTETEPKDVNFTKLVYVVGDSAQPKHTKHFEVIRNQSRYDAIYADKNISLDKPSIDFSSEVVIFFGMGYFGSSGYNIDVTKITKKSNHVVVDVKTAYLGNCGAAESVMTAPRLFVKIARDDSYSSGGGHIVFNETRERSASCE